MDTWIHKQIDRQEDIRLKYACVCMYIYIYMYTYIHIHVCVCVSVCTGFILASGVCRASKFKC